MKVSPKKTQVKVKTKNHLKFHFKPVALRAPLLDWYRQRNRQLPWRELWRQHADPYHIWVSEIMLQQTVIKAVLPVYARFLAIFPSIRLLAAADEEAVRQAVRGLGYYRRFRLMHAAARQLVSQGGAWPTTYESWKALPGIGDYTAAAISSIAFNDAAAVVDGNVERVFCRLLDVREPPNQPALKKEFKRLAQEFLDPQSPGDFNQALMELGQTICTPTSPNCSQCPLQSGCLADQRGSQALAPAAKHKPTRRDETLRLLIVQQGSRFALWQRPDSARFLKGTWGFLTARQGDNGQFADDGSMANQHLAGQPIARVRHSITNHRIAAQVEVLTVSARPPGKATALLPPGGRWYEQLQVEETLVSNLDRKAWKAYLGQMGSITSSKRLLTGSD